MVKVDTMSGARDGRYTTAVVTLCIVRREEMPAASEVIADVGLEPGGHRVVAM
jgi:hypothetical protein